MMGSRGTMLLGIRRVTGEVVDDPRRGDGGR
jgi:hypothetical protein